jgi:hypothetical protein
MAQSEYEDAQKEAQRIAQEIKSPDMLTHTEAGN